MKTFLSLIFYFFGIFSGSCLVLLENLTFDHFASKLVLLIREKNSFEPHVSNIFVSFNGTDDLNKVRAILKHLHTSLGATNTFVFFENEEELLHRSSPKYSLIIFLVDEEAAVSKVLIYIINLQNYIFSQENP